MYVYVCLCVYTYVVFVYLFIGCLPDCAHRGQKRTSYLLALELQIVVIYCVGVKNQIWVLFKSSKYP